ncbi:HlyD family efflux transporter periplasmic adaptor subunit [Marinobacter sp.]|uniref:efflux RND transporter periplasmic adaptor subunit n=1 Tax=Marinobacter sp. TaxID=50741 RepID=UPI0019C70B8A|nr:HlyD family efflux transporter periplasmic adaptor subunit [Marinobacter sp.]MBD3656359.1 HlyD family efflux transporter periplasmic adaptor subunit [Marinobacter sp.]
MATDKRRTHRYPVGKWLFWSLFGVLVLVALGYTLRPDPVWVDLAEVSRGPLEVTIVEEGRTRVKDRYVVFAPVTGFVHRVELDVGDEVTPGELLTRVAPIPASVLDARSRAEAAARIEAARSALNSASQKVGAVRAEAQFARREYERLKALQASDYISAERLQQAEAEAVRAEAMLRSARFDEEVAAHELEAARTRLEVSAARSGQDQPVDQVAVRSPVSGAVLNVVRKSEGVIQAGEAILEVGDPTALEVVVDVLSFDAVKLQPGLPVRLKGWGGPVLEAVVRRVEPVGFEDISALGVEEQRVQVIADMMSPREGWQMLGDGYRVDAEFLLWQAEDVLQVPSSAVFLGDDGPAVFAVQGDVARLTRIQTGRDNGLMTQVTGGLSQGNRVVRHPDRQLEDGVRVRIR